MNRIDKSSSSLEMTPMMWIALAIVMLLGLARWANDGEPARTLDYVEGDRPVILRATEQTHAFSALGVEVTPPKGWSYLAVTDDPLADRPTFVNEATQSIVRLQAFGFQSWPPIDREIATNVYENVSIEWIDADHRRIGRITVGEVDLTIVAMTHATSFEPNESMDEFCNSIRIIFGGD